MNPFHDTDWIDLTHKIARALLEESSKKAVHIKGTIAAIPVDLTVRLEDGQ
jgi:hypothetical protein